MSTVTLAEQVSDAPTPAAGRMRLYARDNSFWSIDDQGVVTSLSPSAAPVFGTELNIAEDTAVSSTTSETFQAKLRMPTSGTITLPAGTYLLEVSYGWNHDDDKSDFEARVMENDVQIGLTHRQEPKDGGANQGYYTTRSFHRVLAAASYHFDLEYRSDSNGDESSIWDAYMRIWRMV